MPALVQIVSDIPKFSGDSQIQDLRGISFRIDDQKGMYSLISPRIDLSRGHPARSKASHHSGFCDHDHWQ